MIQVTYWIFTAPTGWYWRKENESSDHICYNLQMCLQEIEENILKGNFYFNILFGPVS